MLLLPFDDTGLMLPAVLFTVKEWHAVTRTVNGLSHRRRHREERRFHFSHVLLHALIVYRLPWNASRFQRFVVAAAVNLSRLGFVNFLPSQSSN